VKIGLSMMADQRWMDAKASRQERQAAFEEKELVVLMQAVLFKCAFQSYAAAPAKNGKCACACWWGG
jgi:hypothetical protein